MEQRTGDRLERLYDEHVTAVYGFCRGRLPQHDAEDVTADVFHSLAELLRRDPAAEVNRGWFMTAARNRIVDR